VTDSNLEAHKVITIYNCRTERENRIKDVKNTLRWDKTSCHRFAANQARLFVGCLACNLLHRIRDAAFWGEGIKPSIDSIIRRLVKVGARVVYHAGKWYVPIASAFSPSLYYRIIFA
jgi:Transposase DDE domain group 1